MQQRTFHRREILKGFLGGTLIAMPGLASAGGQLTSRHTVIQESWLAGFAHHMGESVWPLLCKGDPLALVREQHNPFDDQAVAVHWNGLKLGYLPQAQNTAIAQMLDRGSELECCIVALKDAGSADERLRFCVCLAA